jgi:hypothetical protein
MTAVELIYLLSIIGFMLYFIVLLVVALILSAAIAAGGCSVIRALKKGGSASGGGNDETKAAVSRMSRMMLVCIATMWTMLVVGVGCLMGGFWSQPLPYKVTIWILRIAEDLNMAGFLALFYSGKRVGALSRKVASEMVATAKVVAASDNTMRTGASGGTSAGGASGRSAAPSNIQSSVAASSMAASSVASQHSSQ